MAPKKVARRPAHPGLAGIDWFGAMICFVSTIIVAAFFLPDRPLPHIVGGSVALYAVVALVIWLMSSSPKKKLSE